jgi:hypothetical protein
MTTTYKSLSRLFRITAFVDVLGWSALTEGIDSLVLRRMKREQSLTPQQTEQARLLSDRVSRARRLDGEVSTIIRELRALAVPAGDVAGVADAVHFWENRHVTFVRFSDNIFLHSSSPKLMMLFVSELLKRGLERGLLLRAGLSCGVAVHVEPESDGGLDARSRDVSLFGDGITTAVAAERAGSGQGVRVLVHRRLATLLGDDLQVLVRPVITRNEHVDREFLWWADFRDLWPDTESVEIVTACSNEWIDRVHKLLADDPIYDWNRRTRDGADRIRDTSELLRRVLEERSGPVLDASSRLSASRRARPRQMAQLNASRSVVLEDSLAPGATRARGHRGKQQ